MVNIYDENDQIIGRVNHSTNLDFYDGRNFSCGSVGNHKGLTKLKNGNYVLINGTDWQGCRDEAEIISSKQALQEILHSGNINLLEEKRFAELKKLYDNMLNSEFSDEE